MNNATQCAFPTGVEGDPGLTKREYFAAMAMQGLTSKIEGDLFHPSNRPELFADWAVRHADALLAALAK